MTVTHRLDQRFFHRIATLSAFQWLALGLTTGIVMVRAITGGLYMLPVYAVVVVGSLLLNQHRHHLTAKVRASLQIALYSVFAFLSISNVPAHAIFFNRIDDILTGALNVFGLGGLANVASWIVNLLLIIGTVIVGGIVVKSMRSRAGDDEEDATFIGKILKILLRIILGDLVLSFFNI